MFERLQERLNEALRTLKGTGVIKEGHIEAAFREIRRALLEATSIFRWPEPSWSVFARRL